MYLIRTEVLTIIRNNLHRCIRRRTHCDRGSAIIDHNCKILPTLKKGGKVIKYDHIETLCLSGRARRWRESHTRHRRAEVRTLNCNEDTTIL